jgi:uncharacterized protein YjbJ (UPF0337 family)
VAYATGKEKPMGTGDDMKHGAEEMKGKVKESVGDMTDNERLQAEGKMDQTKANLKQAGDDVKDAFTDDDRR